MKVCQGCGRLNIRAELCYTCRETHRQTGADLTDKAKERAIASLNQYLLDPIESVLAPCHDGSLAIEVKSPLDLEHDISLPRGNIFHRDLDFPFLDGDEPGADQQLWGAETDDPHIYLAGAGARRGGGVSGIAGHNAAMALLMKG